MKSNIKLTAIIKCILVGICIICLSGCGKKEESSSKSEKVINVTVGEYYLNGDKDNKCISVIDDHTLQLTQWDTDAWVDEMMEPTKDDYPDKKDYEQIVNEMKEFLSKPSEYKVYEHSRVTDDEIYIRVSEVGDRLLCFKYVSDSQGTSLILGNSENTMEFILAE